MQHPHNMYTNNMTVLDIDRVSVNVTGTVTEAPLGPLSSIRMEGFFRIFSLNASMIEV